MSCRSGYPPTENKRGCYGGAGDMDKICRDAYGDDWEHSGNWSAKGCFPGFTQPTCEKTSWDSKYRYGCCLGSYNDAKRCQKDWCPKSASCSDIFKGYCTTNNYANFPHPICQSRCDGSRKDSWCTGAYQTWCAQQSTECPIDPNTGSVMPNCARLSSTGADGIICQNWEKRYPKAFDVAVGSYCKNNDTPDCACINRAQDPQYTKVKNNVIDALGFTGSAAPCWYLPCQDQTGILMTSRQQQELKACPDINICKEVVNMYNEGKISGDINIKQAIKCNFPDYPQPPTSPADGKKSPADGKKSPPPEEVTADGKKRTVFVVVGIIAAVIILLLLLLVLIL